MNDFTDVEDARLFSPIVGTHCIRVWTLSRRGTFRELKLENNNAQSKSTAERSLRTRVDRGPSVD